MNTLVEHLAFSIAHGSFAENASGGCSCTLCAQIRTAITTLKMHEAKEYYENRYPVGDGA